MPHRRLVADRVAQQRAVVARQAYADALRNDRMTVGKIDGLQAEAEKLIPAALDALADRDYEGILDLTFVVLRVPGLDVFGHREKHVGGYLVATYEAKYYDTTRTCELLLLSNARVWSTEGIWDEPRTILSLTEEHLVRLVDWLRKFA